MKEKYGIYLDGEKKAVTEENEYVIDELAPGTEYEVGVSRIVNGRESDIVVVSVETETEEPLLPPSELVVKDVGNRYVEGATAPGEVSEYDTLTIPEIKGLLDGEGIEYKSSARKSELIELLENGEGV